MCSPSPYKRFRFCSGISGIPVNTLCGHLDSKFSKLILAVLCQCLTDGIRCRVNHGKFCTDTIFFADSVIACFPSCCIENLFCFILVIFYFCFFIVPWHLVTYAIRRCSVSIQHILNHFFTVDTNVDRTSDFYITGKIISVSYTVNFFRCCCRKIESTVINCLNA